VKRLALFISSFWLLSGVLCAVVPLAASAQEVIVFSDSRSLVVSSHREQGLWTYLKVESGEIAVKTSQITQIRKEGAEAQQSARAAASAVPSPSPASPQPEKPPPPPQAPPVPQGSGDDDEDRPPPPDGQATPPSRPNRPMPSATAIPQGGQPQKRVADGGPVGR
jgi:hypothetical protein